MSVLICNVLKSYFYDLMWNINNSECKYPNNVALKSSELMFL